MNGDKKAPRTIKATVGVVIASLVGLGYVTYDITEQRQSRADRADCVAEVLADMVKATNERTTYSDELSIANKNQLEAFQALVVASLAKPPPSEKEGRRLVIEYRDALEAYFDVSEKAENKRRNFPFPTGQEIAECP